MNTYPIKPFNIGIVDGTMGILSRKMAMPVMAAPQHHTKDVTTIIDTKKYHTYLLT
jgi:hypothetical protein